MIPSPQKEGIIIPIYNGENKGQTKYYRPVTHGFKKERSCPVRSCFVNFVSTEMAPKVFCHPKYNPSSQ